MQEIRYLLTMFYVLLTFPYIFTCPRADRTDFCLHSQGYIVRCYSSWFRCPGGGNRVFPLLPVVNVLLT